MITDEHCMEWLRSKLAFGYPITIYPAINDEPCEIWQGIGYEGADKLLSDGATLSDAFERATNGWMR